MLASNVDFEEILALAPEWSKTLERLDSQNGRQTSLLELFETVGAKDIYSKIISLGKDRENFLTSVRDHYYQPLFAKMLKSNQNLKRFWIQRRVPKDTQEHNAISLSVELAQKMLAALEKQLDKNAEDGFKVLLPAYAQRSVYNAVVDYVRHEWQWEKDTLQDVNLDPNQADPRVQVADEVEYSPEHQAISGEQVGQLNHVRNKLKTMLGNPEYSQEALVVVDCMFGLGLTPESKTGVEMTMRECCDALKLKGETQARKIARCQVLLDKGLDLIRDMIREDMPGVAAAWQVDININTASRRELNHILGLTEGEVDRLIKNRQYYGIDELVDKNVVKQERISEFTARGAVAAFVPVDLNGATKRDLIDICGAPKDVAGKIVDKRPFSSLEDLLKSKIIDKNVLQKIIENGGVLKKVEVAPSEININIATESQLKDLGLDKKQIDRFIKVRPFSNWSDVESFLGMEASAWKALREKACI